MRQHWTPESLFSPLLRHQACLEATWELINPGCTNNFVSPTQWAQGTLVQHGHPHMARGTLVCDTGLSRDTAEHRSGWQSRGCAALLVPLPPHPTRASSSWGHEPVPKLGTSPGSPGSAPRRCWGSVTPGHWQPLGHFPPTAHRAPEKPSRDPQPAVGRAGGLCAPRHCLCLGRWGNAGLRGSAPGGEGRFWG